MPLKQAWDEVCATGKGVCKKRKKYRLDWDYTGPQPSNMVY